MSNTLPVHRIQAPPPYHNQFCACLYGVFSAEECAEMIARSERAGYVKAKINTGPDTEILVEDYRLSDRCIIDDFALAERIFQRIQHAVPPSQHGGPAVQVAGLNERLRFLRYQPGGFFRPHHDGHYTRPDGSQRSFITMMMYLDEAFEGGSTAFLSRPASTSRGTVAERVEFHPKTGSVLLFEHSMLHEGAPVVSGVKHAVRGDVMYSLR